MSFIEWELPENFNLTAGCSIMEGAIVSVDYNNDTATVNITGMGQFADVAVFYHCEHKGTVEGGSIAFQVDDDVLILNLSGSSSPDAANLRIIGFTDGPHDCARPIIGIVMTSYWSDISYFTAWDVKNNCVVEDAEWDGDPITFPCLYVDASWWWQTKTPISQTELYAVSDPLESQLLYDGCWPGKDATVWGNCGPPWPCSIDTSYQDTENCPVDYGPWQDSSLVQIHTVREPPYGNIADGPASTWLNEYEGHMYGMGYKLPHQTWRQSNAYIVTAQNGSNAKGPLGTYHRGEALYYYKSNWSAPPSGQYYCTKTNKYWIKKHTPLGEVGNGLECPVYYYREHEEGICNPDAYLRNYFSYREDKAYYAEQFTCIYQIYSYVWWGNEMINHAAATPLTDQSLHRIGVRAQADCLLGDITVDPFSLPRNEGLENAVSALFELYKTDDTIWPTKTVAWGPEMTTQLKG